MLYALLAVMTKELRQAFRDRRMAALLLVAPLLQLTLLGYAVDLEVDRIPTVICDLDRTSDSRDLAAALVADQTFVWVGDAREPGAVSELLERGEAAVGLVIPQGYAADLARRRPVVVQVLLDGTDPNRARVAANAAAGFMAERAVGTSLARLEERAGAEGRARALPQVALRPRILFNPRLESAIFMVPGVAAMVLLVVTPIENMPEWLRPITYLDPVRYYLEILRGCLLKGARFVDVLPQLASLTAFGVGLLLLSAWRFRKRLG